MFAALAVDAMVHGVSHGVTSAAAILFKDAVSASGKALFARVFQEKEKTRPKSTGPLEQALAALNLNEEEQRELTSFIASETFGNVLRSFTAVIKSESRNAHTVRRNALARYIHALLPNSSNRFTDPFVDELLDLSTSIIEDAWETATNTEIAPMGWHAAPFAQALIADEFASLTAQAERLANISTATLVELDPFLARYRKQVGQRYSKIRPQTLQETVEIGIEKLYIEPSLQVLGAKSDEVQTRDQMLSSAYRVVLLGNPGAGKSTFAGKLSFDLCQRYSDRSFGGRQLTPVFIVLREFARHKKDHPCSLLEYVELQAKTEYQVPDVPADAFLLPLLNGHVLVIFDGLDELTDTSDRVAIKTLVEHFATAFPSVPILVTSREVGYEQAPLDSTRFTLFKLAPFGEAQVKDYATKWFALTRQASEEERSKLTAAFIAESEIVPDIRTNPLMLGLLCNLYRQDGFIPKNRPDVYQRCADLLFTKWDRHRGIAVQLPMDYKLKPAMWYLAHWIYSDQSLQDGVTERQLVHATATYLSAWKEEWDEAESVANRFVEFFKGRAWVFSDTGSTKSEALYQFTHRTFLEYFTAEHLVKVYATPVALHEHLLPHVALREWDVVCQVAYQINGQRTNSHDILVESLLDSAKGRPLLESLGILNFCARSLDLLYPTPSLRRKAVSECFATLLLRAREVIAGAPESTGMVVSMAQALLDTNDDTLAIHQSEFSKIVELILTDQKLPTSDGAAGLLIAEQCHLFLNRTGNDGKAEGWASLMKQLLAGNIANLTRLARAEQSLGAFAWWQQAITVRDIVGCHGALSVLLATQFPLEHWFRSSIMETIVSLILEKPSKHGFQIDEQQREWILSQKVDILEVLLAGYPFKLPPMPTFFWSGIAEPSASKRSTWPDDTVEADILILHAALMSEATGVRNNVDVRSVRNALRKDLITLSMAKHTAVHRTAALRILDKRCSNDELRRLLKTWVEGHMRFLEDYRQELPTLNLWNERSEA